jgi:RNA polymerase sigma-70 factor, ECF subfamily
MCMAGKSEAFFRKPDFRISLRKTRICVAVTHSPDMVARQIRAGDRKAFEQAFRTYYKGLTGFARKFLDDPDEAEEMVQEVFFTLWSKRESIQITDSLKAYLFRAVRNACFNQLKHARVKENYMQKSLPARQDEERRPENQLETLELQQRIDDCLAKMPPERRKIFLMSRMDDMKYREIADTLSLSIKTVEAQMGKALKFMRESLSDYLPLWLLLLEEGIQLF